MTVFEQINEFLQKTGKSRGRNLYYYLILLTAGLVVILAANHFIFGPTNREEVKMEQVKPVEEQALNLSSTQYHEMLEDKLEKILSQIKGVGDVEVMITLKHHGIYEPIFNTNSNKTVTEENDNQGGTRYITETTEDKQVVIVRKQSDEKPVLRQEILPEVKGVIVVAHGAENPVIKRNLIKAIKVILDVPDHKIQVLAKKN